MTRIPYHIVLIGLSIFIILVLLVGVPVGWKDGLLLGIAIALCILAIAFRKEMQDASGSKNKDTSRSHAFRDSRDSVFNTEEGPIIIEDDEDFIEEVTVVTGDDINKDEY
jgi:hypothetical protein